MSAGRSSPHGWRVGSVRGIPVYIGRTWPLLLLAMAAMWLPGTHRDDLGDTLTEMLIALAVLMISVLLHEGAHAGLAARTGQRVDRIVADLWGGHTVYDASRATPAADALVAAGGPAVNLALAGLAHLSYAALPDSAPWQLAYFLSATRAVNLLVGIFNLLPGLPLDGGQLVSSAVWAATKDRFRGVIVAGWCGRVLTVGALLWFVVRPLVTTGHEHGLEAMWRANGTSLIWSVLICGFLWHGASQAITIGRVHRTRSLPLGPLARPAVLVPHTASVRDAVRLAQQHGGEPVLVGLDPAGEPLGLAAGDPAAYDAAAPFAAYVQVMPRGWVVPSPDDGTLGPVIDALAETDARAVLVDGPGGPRVVPVDAVTRAFHAS